MSGACDRLCVGIHVERVGQRIAFEAVEIPGDILSVLITGEPLAQPPKSSTLTEFSASPTLTIC